jgi:preprotein translocase subunit SecG
LGGLSTARGTANALTRLTALCAAGFFVTSLALGILASSDSRSTKGILEDVNAQAEILAPVEGLGENRGVTFTPPLEKSPADGLIEAPIENSGDVQPITDQELPLDNIPQSAPDAPVSE